MYKSQPMLSLAGVQDRPALESLVPQPQTQPQPGRPGSGPRPLHREVLSRLLKRGIDIAVSGLLLLVLSPVFLFVGLAILVVDGRPILYRHARIGQGGRTFDCYKFRTMARDSQARLQQLLATDSAARAEWEASRKLKCDPRVHRIGYFLRRSSLDELPQLVNILRGDMSLVGPRPIVTEEIARFGADFAAYKSVRPGLTGLWQISGRSATSYEERVALDRHYVAYRSTAVDLRILMRTPVVVLKGLGSC